MIIKTARLGIVIAALLIMPSMVHADLLDAFQNGGFEGWSGNHNQHNGGVPPGWSVTGGSPDVFNGDTDFAGYTWAPSSTGGDFLHCIGGSGSYTESALQVALGGLTIGQEYEISFEQAISRSQWSSGDGYWEIIFGTESQNSETMEILPDGEFGGWEWQTMIFTATAESQTLEVAAWPADTRYRADIGIDSFYLGTPGGNPDNPDTQPPDTSAVPEPALILMLGIALAGIFGLKNKFV